MKIKSGKSRLEVSATGISRMVSDEAVEFQETGFLTGKI
jgi:hypothetical protein